MKTAVLLFSVVVFSACSSTPLSDDEIVLGSRQVTGKVQVSDSENAGGVYVWLEGFDVGTFTNQEGAFKITLPSSAQNSGGVTGIFNLYYYLANYRLAKTAGTMQSGEFLFSTDEINRDGELFRPKFLSRILDVSTVLTPAMAIADSSIFMKVEVVLSSETDSVLVAYPRQLFTGLNKVIAPLFVKNLETGAAIYAESVLAGVNEEDIITIMRGQPFVRTMLLSMDQGLSQGEYEVVPFLRILQPEAPAELLNNLVDDIESFGLDYLDIPFRRSSGVLRVVKGEGEEGN